MDPIIWDDNDYNNNDSNNNDANDNDDKNGIMIILNGNQWMMDPDHRTKWWVFQEDG